MNTREEKLAAMQAGELAGEEAAKRVFRNDGVQGVAATLSPSVVNLGGPSYGVQFAELWKWNGEDNWQGLSLSGGLPKGVHPYCMRAYDEMFAKAAGRFCEMVVLGYLDALNGVPFEAAADGDNVEVLEERLKLRKRRCLLGEREALIWAYEAGCKARLKETGHG
jgi:hypothetical protein